MTPLVPVEGVMIAVLAFLAALALAQAYTSLKRKEQGPAAERKQLETARNEPLFKTIEPNRPRLARSGGP